MNVIIFLKNFWLDFFSRYHKRLIKNASYETPLSTILHLSFTQAINFNTISVVLLHFIFNVSFNFIILFIPIFILFIINCYYYYKLDLQQRKEIIERKLKYSKYIYDIYDLLSTVLFVIILIIASKYR